MLGLLGLLHPSPTSKMQFGLCFDGDKMMDCDTAVTAVTAVTLCIKGMNVTELHPL